MKCKKFISLYLVVTIFLLSIDVGAGNGSINIPVYEGVQSIYLPLIQRFTPWQEVGLGSASGGGISNTPWNSWYPSIAIAPDGTLYLSWQDNIGDIEIYVRAWDGSSWAEVGAGSASGGGISNDMGNSWFPSLSIAPDGTPYVAWQDDNSSNLNSEIYVRAWNGSSWAEVGTGSATGGGISNNTGDSKLPSLAMAQDGTPYVAWVDYSDGGDGKIYVRRWNGSSWVEVGTGSASGDGISNSVGLSENPVLAIAPNGTPYVVWNDWSTGNSEIYVRAWDGNNWEEVGTGSASGEGISKNDGYGGLPAIAIANNNTPYIVWSGNNNIESEAEIYVRAWNGSAWTELGASSSENGVISNTVDGSNWPSIVTNSAGIPYVAWAEGVFASAEIYVRFWNGNN